jgi:hypothetical protein
MTHSPPSAFALRQLLLEKGQVDRAAQALISREDDLETVTNLERLVGTSWQVRECRRHLIPADPLAYEVCSVRALRLSHVIGPA